MRIAIVNDLRLAVETLKRVVLSVPGHEIAWVAADGKEAVEKCAADIPDLVLMDLIMPVMDGVRATDIIMKQSPCAILVVTATVAGNAAKVFEAMGCGALDAVATPVLGEGGRIEGAEELLRKISMIAKLIGQVETQIAQAGGASMPLPGAPPPLVAIGASTGGPNAVARILSDLPAHPGAALVVVQHVDQQFAEGLADWLASQTSLPVKIAEEGEQLRIDQVYVAGTNDHLVLDRDLSFHYTPHPRDNPFRPSVDTFFGRLRAGWPRKDVAVLLTGMGRDGAAGLLELRRAGWHTIVQDEKTSVVYGMPRAAVELGAADEVLPLDAIAHAVLTRIRKRNP